MKNRIVPPAIGFALVALLVVASAIPASADLLPSGQVCSGQNNARADEREQERAARCLIDHVRVASGVNRVDSHRALEQAAGRKAKDVDRCGFSHTACGRPADAWAKHFGYDSAPSWGWGEALATSSRRMSAREAVKAWLNSPPHRATLLKGSYEHIGIAMRRSGGTYWVLELGCHGC